MAKPVLSDLDFGSVARLQNLLDAVGLQEPVTLAQAQALVNAMNFKKVRAASTANITLTAPGATVDGITMVSGDRFLAKDQSTATQNGIYIWNGAASTATRSGDADLFAEMEAALVQIEEGTTNGGTRWRQTAVNGVVGTNAFVFISDQTAVPAATETVSGIAELATQAETDTGTDDLRIITPLKMANWSGRKRKGSAIIGDGSATAFNLDHNFGTRQVIVEVYKNSGNYDTVFVDVTRPTINRVTLTFAAAPAASSYEVVVIG